MERLHSKGFIAGFLLAGFIISVIFTRVLVWEDRAVREASPGEAISPESAGLTSKLCSISLPEEKGGDMKISGYLFKADENAGTVSLKVILRDQASGSCYELPTVIGPSQELTSESPETAASFGYAGFGATAPCRGRLDPYNRCYELYALYTLNGREYFVPLGASVGNGGGSNE